MPIYDFECKCGHVEERIEISDVEIAICPKCGGTSKKMITVSKVNTANQDKPWIRSVREVVEKDSGKQHCEEFLTDPTRKNYESWMKGEGLRPLEVGEKTEKSDEVAIHKKITKEVYIKHRKRNMLEI